MAELDLVVAVAADLDDRRLQLADIIVLHARPSVPSAACAADVALYRLPGCALVAVGVETGGCLMCGHDVPRVLVRTTDPSILATIRLALGYYLSAVLAAADPRPGGPAG